MRITLWIVRGCDLLLVLIIVCFFLNRCGTITKTGMTRASLLRDTREAVVRYLGRPCDDDDSDDALAIHRLFPRNLAGGPRWSHKTGYNNSVSMEGNKKSTKQCVHRRISTQGNDINELWYTVPFHLQPNNTRNIESMVHRYVHPKNEHTKKGKKEQKKGKQEKKKEWKRNENKENQNMCYVMAACRNGGVRGTPCSIWLEPTIVRA